MKKTIKIFGIGAVTLVFLMILVPACSAKIPGSGDGEWKPIIKTKTVIDSGTCMTTSGLISAQKLETYVYGYVWVPGNGPVGLVPKM